MAGYSVLPHITVQPAHRIIEAVSDLSAGEFVAAVIGLTIGLVLGLLLGLPLANFPDPYWFLLPLGVSVVLGLGMMGLTVAKRDDLLDAARDVGLLRCPMPHARDEESSWKARPPTSIPAPSSMAALVDVVASGFLAGTLVVPRFVLGELQHIADDSDPARRGRGRRGLDVLSVLQKDHRIDLDLSDEDVPEVKAVDAKLVALALAHGGVVLTTDYNLNRVAQLQGVRVMNLNNLANAMKPAFLPGEALRVKVIQEGKEPGQGVGYLDDGTMIVVEGGSSYLQRELEVHVTRVLQTVAGRMVFAQPIGADWPIASGSDTGFPGSRAPCVDALLVRRVRRCRDRCRGSSSRMGGGTSPSRSSAADRRCGGPSMRCAVRPASGGSSWSRGRSCRCPATPGWVDDDVSVVVGGARRQDSVATGSASGRGVVLVHDAARPLATPALIDRVAEAAARTRCSHPGAPGHRFPEAGDGRPGERHRGPLAAVPGTDAPGRPA